MSVLDGAYPVSYVVGCLVVLIVIGSLWQNVFYNLHWHPLAHIPGPKLAAATYLYQTYYGLVGGSRYYQEIARLHEKYGKNSTR